MATAPEPSVRLPSGGARRPPPPREEGGGPLTIAEARAILERENPDRSWTDEEVGRLLDVLTTIAHIQLKLEFGLDVAPRR